MKKVGGKWRLPVGKEGERKVRRNWSGREKGRGERSFGPALKTAQLPRLLSMVHHQLPKVYLPKTGLWDTTWTYPRTFLLHSELR